MPPSSTASSSSPASAGEDREALAHRADRGILALLEETLSDAGSSKERILSVQIFLTDISKIGEMNAVWDQWVAKGHAPARATVEAKLASPDYGIEITAVAAKQTA